MDTRLLSILKIMESLELPESGAVDALGPEDIDAVNYVFAQVQNAPPLVAKLMQRIHSPELLTQIFDTSLNEANTITLLTDPEVPAGMALKWLQLMYAGRHQAVIWNALQTQAPDRYRHLKAELERGIQINRGVVIENFNVVNTDASAQLETDRLLDLVETSSGMVAMTEAADRILSTHMSQLPEILGGLAEASPTIFRSGISSEPDFFRFVKWCYLVEPLLAYDVAKTLTKETLRLLHTTLMEMPNTKWVTTILEQLPSGLATGYSNWFNRQPQQNSKIKAALIGRKK